MQIQWALFGFWGELVPQGAGVLGGDRKGDSVAGAGPAGLNDPSDSEYFMFLCITHFKNTMNLEHSFFNKVQGGKMKANTIIKSIYPVLMCIFLGIVFFCSFGHAVFVSFYYLQY